ncbi:hypothetical protein [Scytonema sp. UIC 10036]|uniref:hypothetical protein n=1 Tax=Scytonema sp. UIC 10036 TaxID=2304196 RepID=UPI001A9AB824|nr:hypothetical protein [Scytonema sp. UIC 10036]
MYLVVPNILLIKKEKKIKKEDFKHQIKTSALLLQPTSFYHIHILVIITSCFTLILDALPQIMQDLFQKFLFCWLVPTLSLITTGVDFVEMLGKCSHSNYQKGDRNQNP